MKKCKYCNGKGTIPVKPNADWDRFYRIGSHQPKTVTQCPKCFGKGSK